MIGRYRFYQNGKLLAESRNLITGAGQELILRKLADQSVTLGGAIAVGVSEITPNTGDKHLGFEVDQVPVSVKSIDLNNLFVIYKATLALEKQYSIYEAGLWSQGSEAISALSASRQLATFNPDTEIWTNSTTDTTQSRTSTKSTRIDVTGTSTVSTRRAAELDLSGYSTTDEFNIALYKPNNNIAGLTLVFTTSLGGSFASGEINVASLPVGYNTVTVSKGAFTPTGLTDWSEINGYGADIRAASTGYIILDGLRIEDVDSISTTAGLVSHSLLTTPLVKTNVAPMDIEYAVEYTIT